MQAGRSAKRQHNRGLSILASEHTAVLRRQGTATSRHFELHQLAGNGIPERIPHRHHKRSAQGRSLFPCRLIVAAHIGQGGGFARQRLRLKKDRCQRRIVTCPGLNRNRPRCTTQLYSSPGKSILVRAQRIAVDLLSQSGGNIIGIRREQQAVHLQRPLIPFQEETMAATGQHIAGSRAAAGQSQPLPAIQLTDRQAGFALLVHLHAHGGCGGVGIKSAHPAVIDPCLRRLQRQGVTAAAGALGCQHDKAGAAGRYVVGPAHPSAKPAQFRIQPERAGGDRGLNQLRIAAAERKIHLDIRHRAILCVHHLDHDGVCKRLPHLSRLLIAGLFQHSGGRSIAGLADLWFYTDGLVCSEIAHGKNGAIAEQRQQIAGGVCVQAEMKRRRRRGQMAVGGQHLPIAQQGGGIAQLVVLIQPHFGADAAVIPFRPDRLYFQKMVAVDEIVFLQHGKGIGAMQQKIHIAVVVHIQRRGAAGVAGVDFGAGIADFTELPVALVFVIAAGSVLAGGHDILTAVLVKIGHAHGIAGHRDGAGQRHVLKRTIAFVLIQAQHRFRLAGNGGHGDNQIQIAIVVEIRPKGAVAFMDQVNAGIGGAIDKSAGAVVDIESVGAISFDYIKVGVAVVVIVGRRDRHPGNVAVVLIGFVAAAVLAAELAFAVVDVQFVGRPHVEHKEIEIAVRFHIQRCHARRLFAVAFDAVLDRDIAKIGIGHIFQQPVLARGVGVEQIEIAVVVHIKKQAAAAVAAVLRLHRLRPFQPAHGIGGDIEKVAVLRRGRRDATEVPFILAVLVNIRQSQPLTAVKMIEAGRAHPPFRGTEPVRRTGQNRRHDVGIGGSHHLIAVAVRMQVIRHQRPRIGRPDKRILYKPGKVIAKVYRLRLAGHIAALKRVHHIGDFCIKHHHAAVLVLHGDDLADNDLLQVFALAAAPGQQIFDQGGHLIDIGGKAVGAEMNRHHGGAIHIHVGGHVHNAGAAVVQRGRIKIEYFAATLKMAFIGRIAIAADKIDRRADGL